MLTECFDYHSVATEECTFDSHCQLPAGTVQSVSCLRYQCVNVSVRISGWHMCVSTCNDFWRYIQSLILQEVVLGLLGYIPVLRQYTCMVFYVRDCGVVVRFAN
jgi:hypothetical protein